MEVKENQSKCSLLFIGDIVGEAGREAVKSLVPDLIFKHRINIVIANCENAAAGRGMSP